MRQSQGKIGVISAPICAFYHHSLGGFSIVSVQPCLFFSDSGSKLGQGTTLHKLIEYTLKGAEGKLPAVAVSGPFGTVKGAVLRSVRTEDGRVWFSGDRLRPV